jgi:uncharacterized 2Fe-2S/4Fe-4S cluster protein (DUF4445 family)
VATLIINEQVTGATVGHSLFDQAEQLGVQIPTSCQKQGKCRECIVEVTAGMDCLTPRSPEESHLRDSFRLACRCHVAHDAGEVHCHTMRRGNMRIERQAFSLPVSSQTMKLDPAITRVGDHVFIDGEPVDRSSGPIHGIAIDIGTTTIVLRLFDLETGELVADSSLENPQRFGGSEVMARIRFDTEHRGHLLMRTLAGYLSDDDL